MPDNCPITLRPKEPVMTHPTKNRLLLLALAPLLICSATVTAAESDPASTVKAKLKLLEQAHEAGLLTDEEYAKKKAAIETELKTPKAKPDDQLDEKLKTLKAAHEAGILTDEEYQRKKAELEKRRRERPPKKAGPPKPAEPKSTTGRFARELPPKLTDPQTFRHPTGFTFQYPQGWTLSDTGEGIELKPAEPKTNADGVTEKYMVLTQTVPDATRADDPWVIRYYENQLLMVAPFLERTGDPGPALTVSGRGVAVTWEGKGARGSMIRARAYITAIEKFGVVLAGMGSRDQIAARDLTLRQIFATFRVTEAKRDERLAGTWRANLLTPGSLTGVTRTLTLRPNGTCLIEDAGGREPRRGRWGTTEGKLHIAWPSGYTDSYTYELRATDGRRSLRLQGKADARPRIWREVK
jgi:hypothetical protein